MANEIDLVIGKEAFDEITRLITRLGDVDAKLLETAVKFSNIGKIDPKNTSDLGKLTAENARLNTVIEQQSKDYDVLNSKLAQAVTARVSSTKEITKEVIAQRELNRETTLNIKATTDVVGAYGKLDAQHKQAVKLAQDLAVATGRNTAEYEKAKNKANEFGHQLRVIDTDIGKHTRNVGNYASSWNGLGNSINQLTREAPAFANSIGTGFMALSNNIPILADEIGVLIDKNKDLISQGKPTESVFKTVASAFFSWQTAISLGVTLLTVYGEKIWDSITGAKAKEEALKKETKALEDKNKAEEEAISVLAKYESEEISRSVILLEKAKNLTLSMNDRLLAVKELQERYPDYLGKLDKQKILAGDTADEEQRLNVALILRGKAIASQELLSKNSLEQMKAQIEFEKISQKGWDEMQKQLNPDKSIKNLEKYNRATYDSAKESNNALNILNEKLKPLKEEEKILLSVFNANSKYLGIVKEVNNAKSGKQKVQDFGKVDIELVSELQKVDILLNRINAEIERLKVEKITANTEELPAVSFQLEQLLILRKQLNELPSADFKIAIPPEDVEGVKKQSKEVENYLKSFATEFASKSGMSETFSMLSGEIEGFGTDAQVTFVAVAESAQEMFNMIAESSQASFDAEYARLDKQKQAAISFAGDSEFAKADVEEKFAKKKHEIEVRQFKEKQKITLANIAIDTAQAIVSTWAQVPKYDFGISATALSVMIGAMGAIQAGMVLAQKPPAYAEGTDNHSGGLMLVNDGSGSNFQEKVVLPSGKVIMPQGRNVLMDAPKGTKVLNHEQQLFEMLQNNNISMSAPKYQGMTSEEMDEVLGKHFSNIKTQNTIFDKNGFQSYVRNGNSITRSNSNRSQSIGISV